MHSLLHSKLQILAGSGWFCSCPNDLPCLSYYLSRFAKVPSQERRSSSGAKVGYWSYHKTLLMDSLISSSFALAFCPLIIGEREDIGQWILVFLFFCWIDSIVINKLYFPGIKARNSSVFGNQYVHFNIRVPTYASSPAADLHFYFIHQRIKVITIIFLFSGKWRNGNGSW